MTSQPSSPFFYYICPDNFDKDGKNKNDDSACGDGWG